MQQQQHCLHYTTTEKKDKMGISNKGLQTISTIQGSQMDQSMVRLAIVVQIRDVLTNVQKRTAGRYLAKLGYIYQETHLLVCFNG